MIKTFLYGNINSRKKFTKKICADCRVVNGKLECDLYLYEKIGNKWRFIDGDGSDCPEFVEFRKLIGQPFTENKLEKL